MLLKLRNLAVAAMCCSAGAGILMLINDRDYWELALCICAYSGLQASLLQIINELRQRQI